MKNKDDITKILRVKFNTEFKASQDNGIIEAYVSIFGNVDSDGDIIVRGAFLESLAKKLPKGVWSHNWDMPVAITLEAHEDDKGLYIKGQFNLETQRGKEAYSDLKFGTIDEFSIGFRVLDWEYDDAGHRIIKKVRLYEWSPVLAGANPDTELIDIKAFKDFKYNLKDESSDDVPQGTPHIVVEQDLESNPSLAEGGVKVGDTIYIPDDDEIQSPSPSDDGEKPKENGGEDPENGEGKGGEDPVPSPNKPADGGDNPPAPAPEENQNQEDLGKSLKEFSQSLNNLVVALSPLAEKIENSIITLQGAKVKAEPAPSLKVLRLKQATKQIDKNAELVLRILKNNL